MRLQLRHRTPEALEFDAEFPIASQPEWTQHISDPSVISSILWPDPPLFPLAGRHYLGTSHPHERRYNHDAGIVRSYREACQRLAARLWTEVAGANCLAWAPLRGALPIWRALRHQLPGWRVQPYFPVTSSFVFYPEAFRIRNRKGRPASGRTTHLLELARIRPFLSSFDVLVYIDEMISGGSVKAHVRDLLDREVDREIPVIVVSLADQFGERALPARQELERHTAAGRLRAFLWEGCACLITEDQRYLLGVHYTDYNLGPNVVPMLRPGGTVFPEKEQFDRELFPPE
jgi:hypothetical protein